MCPHPDFPDLDFYKITKKWTDLSVEYPDLIYVNDVALDWDGNVISKTASVWLRQNIDALIFTIGDEAFIQLLTRIDGESITISNLEFLFEKKNELTENEQKILDGIENLRIFWEDQRGKELREKFKVITK